MKYRYIPVALVAAAALFSWKRPMDQKPDYQTVFDTRWTAGERLKWSVVLKGIRWKFPGATHLSTDSLAGLLSRTDAPPPVLLDVRALDEFDVSHLDGAIRVQSVEEARAALQKIDSESGVILYCSVGYRSSELAQDLMDAGFDNLHNLEGGLFTWANEGRPMASGASLVHPYNRLWSTLLDSTRSAPVD